MPIADRRAVALLGQLSVLETQRSVWESHWQELADYISPRKADITKRRTPGDKRTELIFDGTAIHAAEMLAASLHGMLTNPSTPWFSLKFKDRNLDGNDEAKEWLQGVTEVMYSAFHRSNFAEAVHELYSDLVVFGTGVMMVERDASSNLRFSTRHIGECFISEDAEGRVNAVYRKFKITCIAAKETFGIEALPTGMQKKAMEEPYTEVEFCHVVIPRDNYDPTKLDALNKPYASIYIDPEDKQIISEGGFDELPYMCPRWLKASFERGYGRSPAMTALADTKMLSKMSETTIRAAQKQVDPPLMLPDDGFMMPIRTVPGGLNFYRSGTRDRIEPLNTGANNPLGLAMEEQRRTAIRAAFYVDQLTLGQGPQMTATEVIQRTEEKMRLLGPVLGRLQAELLQPLIERVYSILMKQELFATPPEFLQESDVEIEYVSPLAKAQRYGDIQSAMRLFESLAPLSQVNPGVFDYVDMDGLAKHIIRVLGVPATVIKSDEQVAQERAQRQDQEAQAAEQQQIANQAQAMGDAAPMIKAIQQ